MHEVIGVTVVLAVPILFVGAGLYFWAWEGDDDTPALVVTVRILAALYTCAVLVGIVTAIVRWGSMTDYDWGLIIVAAYGFALLGMMLGLPFIWTCMVLQAVIDRYQKQNITGALTIPQIISVFLAAGLLTIPFAVVAYVNQDNLDGWWLFLLVVLPYAVAALTLLAVAHDRAFTAAREAWKERQAEHNRQQRARIDATAIRAAQQITNVNYNAVKAFSSAVRSHSKER